MLHRNPQLRDMKDGRWKVLAGGVHGIFSNKEDAETAMTLCRRSAFRKMMAIR